ncbi:uncharacterized protein F5Z01DRAFT_750592 [Emericellopsis atlantica]|uniref:MAT1-1-2 n=1 Tax=Emericellopsis atlantica TaxID=2614577 RepID=A0A9P7ZM10_9HYPO|nr:uncharacterized protein F5Z01DRAFT_750592 [Emericellopsis atlantica]KAG9254151.1 hypothetical protein F5Z01DRAFT_750592 [Emericellopsis atlantica]
MENTLNLAPLWEAQQMCAKHHDQAVLIGRIALDTCLNLSENEADDLSGPLDIAEKAMSVIDSIFKTHTKQSYILGSIEQQSHRICAGDPLILVKAMMTVWSSNASPLITRDLQETSDYATSIINLGLISMLFTSERWTTLGSQWEALKTKTLLANAAVSLIFATYFISQAYDETMHPYIEDYIDGSQPTSIQIFLKYTWRVAQTTLPQRSPGNLFGLTSEDMKISPSGKRLLVRDGSDTWDDPVYWHPGKQTIGSPWGKFHRNKHQPTFLPTKKSTLPHTMYRLPTSSVKLAETFEEYYEDVELKLLETERQIADVSGETAADQFHRLASASGSSYPDEGIDEDDADEVYEATQEYKNSVSLTRKPILDLRGHATLPFLTTAARALRFDEEPETFEDDFWVMTFGGVEAGELDQ